MQHIERWIRNENDRRQQMQQQMLQLQQQQLLAMNLSHSSTQHGMLPLNTMNQNQYTTFNIPPSRFTMVDAHVMTLVDSLTDGRNLYCITPYCSGGELFDLLEKRTKFPEAEARFWFRQILEVSQFPIICINLIPFSLICSTLLHYDECNLGIDNFKSCRRSTQRFESREPYDTWEQCSHY